MHARERGERIAGVQSRDHPCRGLKGKIGLAAGDVLGIDVASVGEPFRAQQLLRDLPEARDRS